VPCNFFRWAVLSMRKSVLVCVARFLVGPTRIPKSGSGFTLPKSRKPIVKYVHDRSLTRASDCPSFLAQIEEKKLRT
jgi:hypothetical protein